MHERPQWWQPEDGVHQGYGDSGRRNLSGRGPSDERPNWWREDDLPDRDERLHYDADRYVRDDSSGRERGRDGDHDLRPPADGDHRGGRSRLAKMKRFFGNERAERGMAEDRPHHHDDDRRDFRGVGPRTRHDEDEELREEICHRFADDAQLDASEILVRVIDNEAILDGRVRNKRDAEHAYDLAQDIPGIVHVRDRLEVAGRRRGRDRVRRATIGMGYEETRRRWS
ncbi:MAG: BON domain-containing protein [Phycisphaerales bacterium]|nr:BON domain-containing protein [Hyphomonadaceae bacterium]